MKNIKIIYKKVDDLIPYVNNPRQHKDIDKIASSIKNFGFRQPIVIDKDNEIIVGHGRLLASKKLSLKEVPCIVADDLTESQIKAYRIADNKVSEFSDWDNELLELELEELEQIDFDLESIGFGVDDDIAEENFKNSEVDVNEKFGEEMGLTFKLNIEEFEFVNHKLRSYDEDIKIGLLKVLGYEEI